eukprot:Ihof_evm1s511 gene=Ihof_evmTU1s511
MKIPRLGPQTYLINFPIVLTSSTVQLKSYKFYVEDITERVLGQSLHRLGGVDIYFLTMAKPPNDGSFMAWFMKQQEQSKEEKTLLSPVAVTTSVGLSLAKPATSEEKTPHKTILWDSDSDKEIEEEHQATVKNTTLPQVHPVTNPVEEGVQTGDIDKVAAYVAQKGKGVIAGLQEQYSFLTEGRPGHAHFQARLVHFEGLQATFALAKARATAAALAAGEGGEQNKKRGSRWGEDTERIVPRDGREGSMKRQRGGNGNNSDEEWEKAVGLHRKRQDEMRQTENEAKRLTEAAEGKHHIADYLPKEELNKFLRKAEALKTKSPYDDTDYQANRLGQDNVGYKLLRKSGWQDGQGLGAQGQGITAPVGRGTTQGSGLGVERPEDVRVEDDEFDTYRKRMMLAYRYRPNPM